MSRIPRLVAVEYPHHITQRGNYQQKVFEEEEDYLCYLEWLYDYSRKYSLKIWAYCLMTNHVHFVAVPMELNSLAKTFNTLNMRYAQYFNKKKKLRGHLWQGRFYSCILDEKHVYASVRYVENNPVRAGIVEVPHDYKWSSAKSHIYKRQDPVLSNDCFLDREIIDWSAYLTKINDEDLIVRIRKSTKDGRPCGDEGFVTKMEGLLRRELKAQPRGRPCGEK